jgi:hypothetical protein
MPAPTLPRSPPHSPGGCTRSTDEFLRAENTDRPDYLESIFAPPLAPGATGT